MSIPIPEIFQTKPVRRIILPYGDHYDFSLTAIIRNIPGYKNRILKRTITNWYVYFTNEEITILRLAIDNLIIGSEFMFDTVDLLSMDESKIFSNMYMGLDWNWNL